MYAGRSSHPACDAVPAPPQHLIDLLAQALVASVINGAAPYRRRAVHGRLARVTAAGGPEGPVIQRRRGTLLVTPRPVGTGQRRLLCLICKGKGSHRGRPR